MQIESDGQKFDRKRFSDLIRAGELVIAGFAPTLGDTANRTITDGLITASTRTKRHLNLRIAWG
jgi:hypothetical protein